MALLCLAENSETATTSQRMAGSPHFILRLVIPCFGITIIFSFFALDNVLPQHATLPDKQASFAAQPLTLRLLHESILEGRAFVCAARPWKATQAAYILFCWKFRKRC